MDQVRHLNQVPPTRNLEMQAHSHETPPGPGNRLLLILFKCPSHGERELTRPLPRPSHEGGMGTNSQSPIVCTIHQIAQTLLVEPTTIRPRQGLGTQRENQGLPTSPLHRRLRRSLGSPRPWAVAGITPGRPPGPTCPTCTHSSLPTSRINQYARTILHGTVTRCHTPTRISSSMACTLCLAPPYTRHLCKTLVR